MARDSFWALLIDLSRTQGVTIFISTHFMNEGERCDRIALMHAGKVLTQDSPQRCCGHAACRRWRKPSSPPWRRRRLGSRVPAPTLLPWSRRRHRWQRRSSSDGGVSASVGCGPMPTVRPWSSSATRSDSAFALLGPILLTITFGYGISFDVENLSYAVLDRDHSPESRAYLEQFASSRYFREQPPMTHYGEMEYRLRRHAAHRHRDPTRFWPRSEAQAPTRSGRLARWRDAVPG